MPHEHMEDPEEPDRFYKSGLKVDINKELGLARTTQPSP